MIIKSKFRPSWWLRNPHLQTIYANKLSKRPSVDTRRERLELPDGDFLDINFSKRTSGPLVCLFHGLAGCIDSSYIQGAFHALEARGMRPLLMHWRGCSGEPNRLARSYHPGSTEDIAWLVELLGKRYPGVKLMAIGYSVGGNALLKYLGEQGSDCPLTAAMAVCPPLVLQMGANKLKTGLSRGYQRHLLHHMRSQHESKRLRYPHLGLPAASTALDDFWKYDGALTAPLHGFRNVDEYYTRSSSRQFLPRIKVPTHVLYALDDPFFTPAVLPRADALGTHVTLETSRYGGHIGFMSGGFGSPDCWLDTRVADVMQNFHGTADS